MGGKKKDEKQGEKTYQIRPQFKDKFRPQEAKERIQKVVKDKLQNVTFNANELNMWSKEIADESK